MYIIVLPYFAVFCVVGAPVKVSASSVAEAELDQLLHGKSRQDVSAKMARALQDNALMTSYNGHADDDDVFLVEIEKSERGLGLGLIDGLVSLQFFSLLM